MDFSIVRGIGVLAQLCVMEWNETVMHNGCASHLLIVIGLRW